MPPRRARAAQSGDGGGRRLRVVALHGSNSNSNLMKFQLGQLRSYFGSDVEWLFPDGQESRGDMGSLAGVALDDMQRMYFGEHSDFEKRISQGKPFVNWYKIDFGEQAGGVWWRVNRESIERMVRWCLDYFARVSPVDCVVGWAQGGAAINHVANAYADLGQEPPWRMSIQFNPSPDVLLERHLKTPVYMVLSPVNEHTLLWARMYDNCTTLESSDGHMIPTTMPQAAAIYERLAFELRYHCAAAGQELELEATAAGLQAECSPESGGSAKGPRESEASRPQVDASAIGPQELSELLLGGGCAVLDTRPPSTARSRPFPTAEVGLGFTELRVLHPVEVNRQLAWLRKDGRRIVAISNEDSMERCRGYCEILITQYNFQADRVCYLDGGMDSWDLWEFENPAASSMIRKAFDLPPLLGADVASISPQELAGLLLGDACLVVDVREPCEARGRAFPGALKDASLLALKRKPQDVKRKLTALLEGDQDVVAVSVTGVRCRAYCAMLISQVGVRPERVRWLDGGIRSWDKWASEHSEESDMVRSVFALDPTRGRPLVTGAGENGGAAQRKHSLGFLI